jgi:hypothetical protein
MKDAARAIDVAAAQGDGTPGNAAEHVEHLARLDARAEDEIDDYLGRQRAKPGCGVVEATTIADDFAGARGDSCLPAVEDDDVVTDALKLRTNERADEPGATD